MDWTDQLVDMGFKFGPKVLAAVVILAAGWAAGGWAARGSRRMLGRLHLEPPVRSLIEKAIRVFVLALFAILALQNLGIELLPLIAGLGIAGAGVALALQGVLGNMVAGLTILFTRPFRVGDYISIVKEEGEVLDIKLSSTTLGHADRSQVVIPNRKIVGEILHNYGRIRQVSIEIVVAYHADLPGTLAALEKLVLDNPKVLRDPAPGIGIARLTETGVAIAVKPWSALPDHGAATSDLNRAIVALLNQRSVAMPVALREIRVLPAAPDMEAPAGLRASA
ncbi:MAG: mechanosensitive ion channel family protein [Betaproteobacteria bacterium]